MRYAYVFIINNPALSYVNNKCSYSHKKRSDIAWKLLPAKGVVFLGRKGTAIFVVSKRLPLPTNHLPRFLNNPFGIANEAGLSSVFCVTHLSHGFSG